MRTNTLILRCAAFATLAPATACGINAPTYVEPAMSLEVGTGDVFAATQKLMLDFRQPSDGERKVLNDLGRTRGVPIPWLRRKDLAVSIQYTITNLSDRPGVAEVLVNGANEYTSYDVEAISMYQAMQMGMVGQQQAEEEEYLPSLIETKPVEIAAKGSFTGNIREDDLEEATLDLDAIGRFMAPYLTVLLHDSDKNRIGLEMVPANVELPQLYQIFVTLKADRHMKMAFLVRIRDGRGLIAEGDDPLFRPSPMVFMPPAPMMMP